MALIQIDNRVHTPLIQALPSQREGNPISRVLAYKVLRSSLGLNPKQIVVRLNLMIKHSGIPNLRN